MSIDSPDCSDVIISAQVQQVIHTMTQHVLVISEHYGPESKAALQTASSFASVLGRMMSPSIRLWPDSGTNNMSLSGVTASGMTFGIIWRPDWRHCTIEGCDASGRRSPSDSVLSEDVTGDIRAYRFATYQTIADHEHKWDLPSWSPTPGTWSMHS